MRYSERFTDLRPAIEGALKSGCRFAAVKDFGSRHLLWFCDDGKGTGSSGAVFVAVPWLGKWSQRICIRQNIDVTQAMALPHIEDNWDHVYPPQSQTTDSSFYLEKVTDLIEQLKDSGGKTIVSRIITGNTDHDIVLDCLDFLDSSSEDSFRCIFYTPQSGCWIMASPELLASYHHDSGSMNTMALAGTRPVGTAGAWDIKNINEQQIVTDFIANTLKDSNVRVIIGEKHTLRAAGVEHLCTPILAQDVEMTKFTDILDQLSPTPALCGSPRDVSIERIVRVESHERRMYGGYMGIVDEDGSASIAVTLRCAQIGVSSWCAYAGGGITAESNAQDEWVEGMMKAGPMTSLFMKPKPELIY